MAQDLGQLATLDRRRLVTRAAAGLAGSGAAPGRRGAGDDQRLGANPFTLGAVASGDPTPDAGVVLWTRLAPRPLAADGSMPDRRVTVGGGYRRRADAARGAARHRAGRAGARPLGPCRGRWPAAGPRLPLPLRRRRGGERGGAHAHRTAAQPAPAQRLRFAFCTSKLERRLLNALARMAEEDLDLVLHLGDYIYEGVAANGGVRAVALPPLLQGEATTLARYRAIHSLYKTDLDLPARPRPVPVWSPGTTTRSRTTIPG